MKIYTISEADFNDLAETMEWMRDQTKDHPNSHGHGASIGKLEMLSELRDLFIVENRTTPIECASNLRQLAKWVREANSHDRPMSQRIGIEDVDHELLDYAASLID